MAFKRSISQLFAFSKTFVFLAIIGFFGFSQEAVAKFSTELLEASREGSTGVAFGDGAKAMAEALEFSTREAPTRSKLPGNMKYFIETGASAFDIDDQNLVIFSDNGYAPDALEKFFIKAGVGLPYGFYFDAGVSQVFEYEKLTSIHSNIAFQALDFANIVYTDMVPSLALSSGVNYILSGPSQFSVNTQMLLGAYHRLWMAQVTYILSVSWVNMTAISPSYDKWFVRHGISSHWPLFEGIFLTANMHYKPVEAGISLGYQF